MSMFEHTVRGFLDFLPIFLLRIQEPGQGPGGDRRTVYIIIRRRFAYLEELLRRAFEGEGDVRVVVDRRLGERRTSAQRVAPERRRGERGRPQQEVGEVIIGEVSTA